MQYLLQDPNIQAVAHVLCWHPYFALLPFIMGIVIELAIVNWFVNPTFATRASVALNILFCPVFIYAGMTGVAAAMDVWDASTPAFGPAYAIGMFEVIFGLLAGYVLLLPTLLRLNEEEQHAASLRATIDGYKVTTAGQT